MGFFGSTPTTILLLALLSMLSIIRGRGDIGIGGEIAAAGDMIDGAKRGCGSLLCGNGNGFINNFVNWECCVNETGCCYRFNTMFYIAAAFLAILSSLVFTCCCCCCCRCCRKKASMNQPMVLITANPPYSAMHSQA